MEMIRRAVASGEDISAFFDGCGPGSRGRRWCGRSICPPPALLSPRKEQEAGEAAPALDRRTLSRNPLPTFKKCLRRHMQGFRRSRRPAVEVHQLPAQPAVPAASHRSRTDRRPPKARRQMPGSPSAICAVPTPPGPIRLGHPNGGGGGRFYRQYYTSLPQRTTAAPAAPAVFIRCVAGRVALLWRSVSSQLAAILASTRQNPPSLAQKRRRQRRSAGASEGQALAPPPPQAKACTLAPILSLPRRPPAGATAAEIPCSSRRPGAGTLTR